MYKKVFVVLGIVIILYVMYRQFRGKSEDDFLVNMLKLSDLLSGIKKSYIGKNVGGTYNYVVSLFTRDKNILINSDYEHKYPGTKSNSYFYTSGVVIDVNNNGIEYIFVGGGKGQHDGLLKYNKSTNKLENKINGTKLSSLEATYGGVSIDLDKDGYDDLIVSRESGVYLYKNNKDGTFTKKQIMKLKGDVAPIGISVGDYNKDGFADLYISQFIGPTKFKPNRFNELNLHGKNVLLKGNGTTFVDVTNETNSGGKWNTFTSIFSDLDKDGNVDLVLSPDAAKIQILKNYNGKFKDVNVPSDYGFWMGIASGDYDNDGDNDLFLTNIGNDVKKRTRFGDLKKNQKANNYHILLRNDGEHKYVDVSKQTNTDNYGFGWGSIFDDINLDGQLDIIFAQNSYFLPQHHITPHSGEILMNTNGKFKSKNIMKNKYFGQTPIALDLDGDKVNDYVWINLNGFVRGYLNKEYDDNNFVNIKLPNTIDFVNAKINVITNNNNYYKENIKGGMGLASGQSNIISFGLGKETKINKIYVKTLYNKEYEVINPKINSLLVLKDFLLNKN